MHRRLTPDERQLWSRVARTVRAAPGKRADSSSETEVSPPASVKPLAAATSGRPVSRAPPRPSPPQDLSGQRRIRRGQHAVAARLDLHGHTQETARREVIEFVLRQAELGARCVLVITGKGRGGAGVLRARLLDWIADPNASVVVAGYASAHSRHGGAGATYVFLRSGAS